jgi:beta-N-acetylhexosaminidase
MTGAAVEGMRKTDVYACVAAFPGEGGLKTDPDKGAGATDKSLEDLQSCEMLPFRSAVEAGAPMVMVSAMQAPSAGAEEPCMLSATMVSQMLRTELGFEGVVVTAPIGQIPSSAEIDAGSAATRAITSGADMILVCKHDQFEEARQALIDAVNDGSISEDRINESLIRIYSMELDKM